MYCRISKEDETGDESESILNQKSMLESYCREKGYTVYNVYTDEDYSGIRSDRPEFKKMLLDAENRCFDIVLCKTMSRFSRDMSVIDNYVNNRFPELGIRFISLVDNTDSCDKSNKKTRQINSLINEWYLEDLSENIRAVFKDKMKKGECLFAFAPYGYKKDAENKNHLVKDEEAFENVKRIYWLYSFGTGVKKIAGILNDSGTASPMNYRKNIQKSEWTGGTVKDILTNPVYTGDLVQNRKNKLSYKSKKRISVPEKDWIWVENTHEAIIDKKIYNFVQNKIRKGSRSGKDGTINPINSLFECECGGKCIRKGGKIICTSCSIKTQAAPIAESIKRKLGIKKENEIFLFAVQAMVKKIIIGEKCVSVEWIDID